MKTVNISAARTYLSRLIDEAASGEEIVITRAGKPVARLVALVETPSRTIRRLGRLAGKVTVPKDFDAPLPKDVLDRFEGM